MDQDQRRVRKYIFNLILAVLVIGVVTVGTVSIIRSAGHAVQNVSSSSARG